MPNANHTRRWIGTSLAIALGTIAAIAVLPACGDDGQQAEEGVTIQGPTTDPDTGIHTFTVQSPYLGKPSTVRVLLPDKVEPDKTYRTLYVLPVEGGTDGPHGDGLTEVRKADAHNQYAIICVTMSFDSVPWYGAHATDPTKRHEQFIKQVVVPLVESRFPAGGKADDRLLLGFSKSGWGAVSMLLRDPDFWGAACTWDAPLMMDDKALKWGSAKHFGTPEQAAPYVPATLVKQQADKLAQGPARLTILGQDIFGKHTREFHELLDAHKVPHRYRNDLKFKHHWHSGWVSEALPVFLGEGHPE